MKKTRHPFLYDNNTGHGLFACIECILNLCSVKFTSRNLELLVIDHPDFPSLLTIKDVLAAYNIDSLGIRASDFDFTNLVTPFICIIKNQNSGSSDFRVVLSADNNSVKIWNNKNSSEADLSAQEFEAIFMDIILLIDSSNAQDEPNFDLNLVLEKSRRKHSLFLLFLFSSLFILYPAYSFFSTPINDRWFGGSIYTISVIGLLLSSLLFLRNIGSNIPLIKKSCGGIGDKNCDAVTKSKRSHFLGVGWTVWGVSYFLSICLSYILLDIQKGQAEFWAIISVAVSPIIFFSIIYQWKFLKTWCVLCVSIQGLLCISLIMSSYYLTNFKRNYFSEIQLPSLISLFLISVIALIFIEFLLKELRTNKLKNMRWDIMKLKEGVFDSILGTSEDLSLSSDDFGILIGNSEATTEIIFITNPFCESCYFAHKTLTKIVNRNPNVKLKIIFKVRGDLDDVSTVVAANFHSIFYKYGNKKGMEILEHWFNDMNGNTSVTFFDHFNIENDLSDSYIIQLLKIRQWCDSVGVNTTPTIIINGKKLPDVYDTHDLCYFY